MPSPFIDSSYAQPGLTLLTKQYPNPAVGGQSIMSAIAAPSAKVLAADVASVAKAVDKGANFRTAAGVFVKAATPSKVKADMTSHSDTYRNFFDAQSIKRNYTG